MGSELENLIVYMLEITWSWAGESCEIRVEFCWNTYGLLWITIQGLTKGCSNYVNCDVDSETLHTAPETITIDVKVWSKSSYSRGILYYMRTLIRPHLSRCLRLSSWIISDINLCFLITLDKDLIFSCTTHLILDVIVSSCLTIYCFFFFVKDDTL